MGFLENSKGTRGVVSIDYTYTLRFRARRMNIRLHVGQHVAMTMVHIR